MHFHVVDAYQETGSLLHCADARVKVIVTFVLILLIALTPMGAFGAYVGFFALVMAGVLLARVDPLTVLRRSLVALPFAGAAISLIFTVPGPSLARSLCWDGRSAPPGSSASPVLCSRASSRFNLLS